MKKEQDFIIRNPSQKNEYDAYYFLRWQVLRAPWNQDKGSEKDELENEAIHRIAILDNIIVACGRLHFIDETTAQIRYMAVSKNFEKKGFGTKILTSLEDTARIKNHETIILNARDNVVYFYEKHGYQVIKKSHLLFNDIQHYEMKKNI